jgi:hypothetical protein
MSTKVKVLSPLEAQWQLHIPSSFIYMLRLMANTDHVGSLKGVVVWSRAVRNTFWNTIDICRGTSLFNYFFGGGWQLSVEANSVPFDIRFELLTDMTVNSVMWSHALYSRTVQRGRGVSTDRILWNVGISELQAITIQKTIFFVLFRVCER